jgi:hypothetical protein
MITVVQSLLAAGKSFLVIVVSCCGFRISLLLVKSVTSASRFAFLGGT